MANEFIANPRQAEFLRSTARFVGYVGGIGAGKTAVGAVKSVVKINEGHDGIIVAPDFPHFARSTWPQIKRWFPWSRCTNAHLDHPYTQKKVLEFNVRGRPVTVYYGGIEDEDSWTGPTVNWFFFDEGRRKRTRAAFDVLAGRIRVGHNPQGWVTSSPNGVGHWMYDVFVKGVFPPEVLKQLEEMGYQGPVVEYFKASTADNRANLDAFYYASLQGLYQGAMAEQELQGEFVSLRGRVWPAFSQAHNGTEDADYVPGVPVEWWVDDGFTVGHPRVILLAQEVPPYVQIFDCYHATYEHGEDSIRAVLAKGYPPPDVVYIDSSAAELKSRMHAADLDTVNATHDVLEGVKHVAPFIDRDGVAHLRVHPRCERVFAEVGQYEWDEAKGRPLKEDDHVADAIRYGLHTRSLEELIERGAGAPAVLHRAPEPLAPAATVAAPAGSPAWYREQFQRLATQDALRRRGSL